MGIKDILESKRTPWIIATIGLCGIALMCILTIYVVSITAQPLPYSLSGHIMDNNSDYIVGADIILMNERTGDTLELNSATNGEYQDDAYNFDGHYQNGDIIRYNVTYGDVGAVETAKIDISKGGTMLDIILTVEDSPETTPNPRPKRISITKKSAEMYPDADGDGISDNQEKIKGFDPNDPCDPYQDSAQCILKNTPSTPKIQVTPEVFSPVKLDPTPIPTPMATPRPTPVAVEPMKEIPGFSAVWCVAGLIFVVFLLDKKRREEK